MSCHILEIMKTQRFKINFVDKSQKERFWQISNDVWKAANQIITCQQLTDYRFKEVYTDLGIDDKVRGKIMKKQRDAKKAMGAFAKENNIDKKTLNFENFLESDPESEEAVKRINLVENIFDARFGKKRQALTETVIKSTFPDLPSCVTNRLNNDVFACFNKEKTDVRYGKRSLRTYRDGLPIPVSKISIDLSIDDKNHHIVTWKLSRSEQIKFKIYYGRDYGGYKNHIKNIINGASGYGYSAPSFQFKKNSYYLLLPIEIPKINVKFKDKLCVGADLGLATSAYCGLSKGLGRKDIGTYQDFVRVRTKVKSQVRRFQKSLEMVKGGHGRKKKLKALERLKESERNFVHTYNHMVSRRVVNFALQHQAGIIKLEFLKGYSEEQRNDFVLRNWSYFELQSMIKYKAKEVGIEVVFVDPYHTSQTCNECNHYEPGQRNGKIFKCLSCGVELDADYNASVNIARSQLIVTKKDQCQYHKIEKQQLAEKQAQPDSRLEVEVVF